MEYPATSQNRNSVSSYQIAEDVLSCGISQLVYSGRVQLMSGPRACATPSHVLYADDIMVFCRGTKRHITALLSLIS